MIRRTGYVNPWVTLHLTRNVTLVLGNIQDSLQQEAQSNQIVTRYHIRYDLSFVVSVWRDQDVARRHSRCVVFFGPTDAATVSEQLETNAAATTAVAAAAASHSVKPKQHRTDRMNNKNHRVYTFGSSLLFFASAGRFLSWIVKMSVGADKVRSRRIGKYQEDPILFPSHRSLSVVHSGLEVLLCFVSRSSPTDPYRLVFLRLLVNLHIPFVYIFCFVSVCILSLSRAFPRNYGFSFGPERVVSMRPRLA